MTISNEVESGHDFGFWAAGHTVYAAAVVVVNITLLKLFNEYNFVGEILIFLSIFSFWISIWVLSHMSFSNELYRIWDEFMGSAAAWLGIIFCSCWVLTVTQMIIFSIKFFRTGSLDSLVEVPDKFVT